MTCRNRKGFTLVELIVFVAIFSFVVLGFITVFIAVTRVQSQQVSLAAVQSEGQYVTQQIQYYVQSARLVDMTQDAATGTLKLRTTNMAQDPVSITMSSGTFYLQLGSGGSLLPLTSGKVAVSSTSFIRHYNLSGSSSAYGQDSISYSFTLAASTTNPTKQYSQTFQSSVAVLAPVPKIALIQQAKTENSGSGIGSVAAAYAGANATGSLLIAVVSNTGTSTASISVADTAGNTWTKIANPKYAFYNQEIGIFDAPNAKNATNTVTATFGTNVNSPSIFIYEYRGAATSSSFDASSTQTQAATASPTSGSANATSGVELVLGAIYSNPSTETPAAGTGFTMETTSTVSATYVEDMNMFVTGPVSAGFGYSQTTPSSSVTVVTFR